jgi:hypothetical protein
VRAHNCRNSVVHAWFTAGGRVRGKEAVSMEAFAVDVHFQGIVREVKLDASTKLDEAFVGVLHAKVIEQLPEGDARRAASLELQVSIGNDEFLAFGEVLKQLPDDARVLSSLAPEASEADTAVPKPFMKLVEVEASAEIMLVNGAGERKGVLKLPEETTVPLLRKELGAHFQSSTGLSNVKLQYPAKKPGLWLDLKEPKPDATILSAVEGAIKGLFPLIKPSVPTSISSLRIIVPDDCAPIMPAEAQVEAEPKGQAPQAAQAAQAAQDLAKVLKAFKKSGKEVCLEMMHGNDESECFIETLGDGKYVCSICCDAMGKLIVNPGKLGEGMSGLARHLLTKGHVQARHARMNGGQGLSKVDAEMLMAGASSTLTFKRYQNTSRATAAKVARIAGEVAKGNMGFTPPPMPAMNGSPMPALATFGPEMAGAFE